MRLYVLNWASVEGLEEACSPYDKKGQDWSKVNLFLGGNN